MTRLHLAQCIRQAQTLVYEFRITNGMAHGIAGNTVCRNSRRSFVLRKLAGTVTGRGWAGMTGHEWPVILNGLLLISCRFDFVPRWTLYVLSRDVRRHWRLRHQAASALAFLPPAQRLLPILVGFSSSQQPSPNDPDQQHVIINVWKYAFYLQPVEQQWV